MATKNRLKDPFSAQKREARLADRQLLLFVPTIVKAKGRHRVELRGDAPASTIHHLHVGAAHSYVHNVPASPAQWVEQSYSRPSIRRLAAVCFCEHGDGERGRKSRERMDEPKYGCEFIKWMSS